jgi:broad specificity phosphatase PhoE
VIAAFTEIDFGRWEGLTAEEVAATDPIEHARWRASDGDWGFPGGETRRGFRDRVGGATAELLAAAEGRALLVLHKGVVKVIVGTLLGEAPELYSALPCELGSVYVLERTGGQGWRLQSPCRVEHLGADRLPSSR